MNNNRQIQMVKRTQAKFSRFLEAYRTSLRLPAFKALHDLCQGILGSGSLIVNQIAIKLDEKISVKKTAERLYRNISHGHFDDSLRQMHMSRQCSLLGDDDLILVDESDIVKPEAIKMEGLHPVWDGSKSRYDMKGYYLLNIIAYQKQKTGYRIYPVSSDLFSTAMENESIANLLHDRIDETTIFSNNRGILVFDRGFDSRIHIGHLVANENSFIIRGVGKRNLTIEGKEQSFRNVCLSVPLIYRHAGLTPDTQFRCGLKRVNVRTDSHPHKNAETVELWLVVARYESSHDNGYFYFFCDFPHRNLTEAEIVYCTLTYYHLRWKIEQVHRQLKQDYRWEAMQLLSYESLKNLNMAFWIAISFMYSCKNQILLWAEAFPRQFDQYRKKRDKLYEFVYGALMKAIRIVFENWNVRENKRRILQLPRCDAYT